MSTVYDLDIRQRHLLTRLCRQGGTWNAAVIMACVEGARPDDLVDLQQRNLISATRGAETVDLREQPYLPTITIALTERGRYVYGHHVWPCETALATLATRGRRGASIPDVLRHSPDDPQVFRFLFRYQLVEMRGSDGEPTEHRPSWEEAFCIGNGHNWPGITVHITPAGRDYLNI